MREPENAAYLTKMAGGSSAGLYWSRPESPARLLVIEHAPPTAMVHQDRTYRTKLGYFFWFFPPFMTIFLIILHS